ncbi:MAG: MgtC/SapB family protein [Acidobacteria bacterium]|nr:MAG: MgtC/SapB family protein [Acidobacteriota bacterium]
MLDQLAQLFPPEGTKIVLVLFLSFLVGIEREEHKGEGDYAFGGVRTFPLIGLIGYGTALLSGGQAVPVSIGFAIVAGFMLASYLHKIGQSSVAGATSEMSGLTTYLIGALVYAGHFWEATTLAVVSLLLLELKVALESLARKAAPGEILTFAKFLLLTAVILPVLPDQEMGPFHLNPARTWLVVVAVSSLSYGSYVIQKATQGRGGVLLSAVLGGAYSSTMTTVVLARRSRRERRPHLFAGGMLVASGVMFLRLAGLLALFNGSLAVLLGPPFLALAATAMLAGVVLMRLPDPSDEPVKREYLSRNPLELGAALLFAGLFLGMLVATELAVQYVGARGVYVLAAIMGVADVDPFIMGMTQAAGSSTAIHVAAIAILITVASNNALKGGYAAIFGERRAGLEGLTALLLLAVVGLLPILWLI